LQFVLLREMHGLQLLRRRVCAADRILLRGRVEIAGNWQLLRR
jgi:hypothetical protein